MAKLEVMNPVAQVDNRRSPLAPRPTTLDNKRIALYWNGKGGGDAALTRVGQLLESRFKGVKTQLIYSSIPGPKAKVEEAKKFDVAVGTTGD